jgi:uncharacterized protein
LIDGAGRPADVGAVRHLTRQECLTALRDARVGRLAVSQGALPLILPVNHALQGANIFFRARQGGVLDRTCRNTVVAFEVDGYDDHSMNGWSVVVVGVANVQGGGEWLRAAELGLAGIGTSDGSVFVKIVPGTITGREVGTDPDHGPGAIPLSS